MPFLINTIIKTNSLITVLLLSGICYGQQTVTWTSLVNATPIGTGLTRTSTSTFGGAISTQVVPATKTGRIDVIFSTPDDRGYVGLSTTNPDANYNTIKYCWFVDGKKSWSIVENGTERIDSESHGPAPSYTSVYSIIRNAGQVTYLINNAIVYTSTVSSTQALFVDVSITGSIAKNIPAVTITYDDPLGPPSDLTAAGVDESVIKLTWRDNSTQETGFEIERSLSASTGFSLIGTVDSNVTTYLDNSSIAPATVYYYRARAINSGTGSGYSNVVQTMSASSTNWLQNATSVFLISNNVGIGTPSPDTKLTVKGAIHADEVRVDLSVPGPDYVFKEDYELISLDMLQKYINENSHLPEIPAAPEMEATGIELGKMNMLLLKKVEELTLYILQQEKRIKALEQEQTNK